MIFFYFFILLVPGKVTSKLGTNQNRITSRLEYLARWSRPLNILLTKYIDAITTGKGGLKEVCCDYWEGCRLLLGHVTDPAGLRNNPLPMVHIFTIIYVCTVPLQSTLPLCFPFISYVLERETDPIDSFVFFFAFSSLEFASVPSDFRFFIFLRKMERRMQHFRRTLPCFDGSQWRMDTNWSASVNCFSFLVAFRSS